MGVPSTPSKPDDTIEKFWDDWRAMRKDSGVTIEVVAKQAQTNKTFLYDLGKEGKKAYPGEAFVDKLLTIIKLPEEDRQVQLQRYLRLQAASQIESPVRTRPSWYQLWLIAGSVALVSATAAVVITMLIARPASPPTSTPYAAIRVQNMVALGPSDLREDETPAYLSSRTIGRCAAKNCEVAGTKMDTGTLLVATCQSRGDELVNYNLDSTWPDNPHRARSNRWYKVQLPDGRTGFINEVYIDPQDRGGLGLATCT